MMALGVVGVVVAFEGLVGGLLNTLPLLLVGFGMIWSPAGLSSWCGSKEERRTLIRIARRGVAR